MPKIKHMCQNPDCDNSFMAYESSNRKYCSRRCNGIINQVSVINGEGKKIDVECDLCGEVFMKDLSSIKKTKSNYCCKEHFYIHTRIKKKVICECDYCGSEVHKIKSVAEKGANYCDILCMGRAKRTYARVIKGNYQSILTQEEYQHVYKRIRSRNRSKKMRLNLSNTYIKELIKKEVGGINSDIPTSLIKAKREQLKIRRLIIEEKQ